MFWDGCAGGWGTMMIFMALFWLLALGGIVWFIVWLVRKTGPHSTGTQDSALDIINNRYARGEISRDEFERMKRDISSTG